MEISLREWLIIGGILVIALILFDGWRRIRGNRSRIRMNIDRSVPHEDDSEELSQSNPELPNGGARKIAETKNQHKAEVHERREPSFGRFDQEPDPEPLNAESDRIPDWPAPEPEVRATYSQPSEQQDLLADSEAELDPLFDDVPVDRSRQGQDRGASAGAAFGHKAQPAFAEAEPRQGVRPLTASRDEEQPSEPEPLSLDFDPEQPIPVLMDRVRPKRDAEAPEHAEFSEVNEPEIQQPEIQPEPKIGHRAVDDGSSLGEALDMDEPKHQDEEPFVAHQAEPVARDAFSSDVAEPDSRAVAGSHPGETAEDDSAPAAAQGSKDRPAPEITADPEEMLVIFVVARQGETLPGAAIHRIAEACGMEIGAMDIYHRHENPNAQGSLQFSMANAIQPGTFDLASIDELETPAVTFFMSMRDPADPMYAYECMLATAETLARHLEAEMLDGDRSVMRPQTKEHYRERIRDFEIHKRVRRAH
ncbi:cell division protein ZipA [Marinobacterium mangrovicola]|uniref:Cell division protein ZipA n=1 Tax=Marinobacterium mangrovicola TaxID=1476959 RepID=A0A4R1GJN7_9GAMM|nr:cell division protein ZipA [Marinobacterium mangrovicola]TCK07105.1 cell division protein ZipA [Marinobacterium mangrovicola]